MKEYRTFNVSYPSDKNRVPLQDQLNELAAQGFRLVQIIPAWTDATYTPNTLCSPLVVMEREIPGNSPYRGG